MPPHPLYWRRKSASSRVPTFAAAQRAWLQPTSTAVDENTLCLISISANSRFDVPHTAQPYQNSLAGFGAGLSRSFSMFASE